MALASIEFRHRRPGDLKPDPRNPRTHDAAQLAKLAHLIAEVGFVSPVLVDEDDRLIAGHARQEVACNLRLDRIPAIHIAGLDEQQKLALMLADNKLPLDAGWDEVKLGVVLEQIVEFDSEFDLELTGFEVPEIDVLLDREEHPEADPADELPEPDPATQVISRRGDLWLLGEHRLACGDAACADDHARLMRDERAAMGMTDPPYNLKVSNIGGRGDIQHREFIAGSGELSEAEYAAFLEAALRRMALASRDGALLYVFMDWRHVHALFGAARSVGLTLVNLAVWAKTNAGQGSFYRSQHELVPVFRSGKRSHRNNVRLGRYGRNRSNLWTYPGVNSFGSGRLEELQMHPTVKPVALVADAIKDATKRGEIVLDPFLGSGTTAIAAERTGRRCFGMELDPGYADVAVRRWQQHTGEKAHHADTGQSFTESAQQRLDERKAEDAR